MPSKILYSHTIHYRERTEPIKYIIIHCSAYPADKMIDIMNENGISTHYIVSKQGDIIECCPPKLVAYHAGISKWLQSKDKSLNGCSIGIELESHNLGQNKGDYSVATIRNLNILLKKLITEYNIRPENILGHSDISPTRKPDPGAGFPWQTLYKKGFAIWYNLQELSPQTNEDELLQSIGYDISDLPATRYAFCRHFYPETITSQTNLQNLLDTPYPKDFTPENPQKYIKILRAVAQAFTKSRQK